VTTWQRSFLAVRVALGASVPEAVGSLRSDAPEGSASDVSDLCAALSDPSRAIRAHALAVAITAVAVDVERMRLR
jgi:hypothetical protein